MVTITKDLAVAENPQLIVYSDDGEYADTDLILCAEKNNPSIPMAQLQAQFVKFGSVVYQHNTPEALGAALFAMDPESTHDAVLLYKEEEARKLARSAGTLEPTEPVPAPDSPEPAPEVVAEEPTPIPEEEEEDVKFFREQAEETASTTPETVIEVPEEPMPIIEAGEPELELPIGETSTTTPEVIEVPAVDISTTTPE